ncbi:MAG: hypothetical protein WBP02_20440, partial [Gammaproteobacteria bacterium]
MEKQGSQREVNCDVNVDTAISEHVDKIVEEQVRMLYSNATSSLLVSLLVAILTTVALSGVATQLSLGSWMGAMVFISLVRLVLVQIYNRYRMRWPATFWRCWYTGATFVAGLIWGGLGLILEPSWPVEHQVVVFMALAGISAGAITSYAVVYRTYTIFVTPVMVLLAIKIMTEISTTRSTMGLFIILFTSMLMLIAYRHSRR